MYAKTKKEQSIININLILINGFHFKMDGTDSIVLYAEQR